MRRTLFALVVALLLAGCVTQDEVAPPDATINPRCAQLSQEVVDAYNRGDHEAEKAAADEFDRLAEAGECD